MIEQRPTRGRADRAEGAKKVVISAPASDPDITLVLGVFPQGCEPVFRVTAQDGASTLCSGEHLWTVSTAADQTPLSAGNKVSDVTQGGRRTARFVSGVPIRPDFAVLSARYAEKHRRHAGVDLAVYYHPAHAWNVDRMLDTMAAALIDGAVPAPLSDASPAKISASISISVSSTLPTTELLNSFLPTKSSRLPIRRDSAEGLRPSSSAAARAGATTTARRRQAPRGRGSTAAGTCRPGRHTRRSRGLHRWSAES